MAYSPLVWLWARENRRDWRRVGSFESPAQASVFVDLLSEGRETVTLPAGVYPRPGYSRRW